MIFTNKIKEENKMLKHKNKKQRNLIKKLLLQRQELREFNQLFKLYRDQHRMLSETQDMLIMFIKALDRIQNDSLKELLEQFRISLLDGNQEEMLKNKAKFKTVSDYKGMIAPILQSKIDVIGKHLYKKDDGDLD